MVGESPEIVDLFSGAGGLSLGFAAAGSLIRAAVDKDSVAAGSFLKNFTHIQPDRPPKVISGQDADLGRLGLDEIPIDHPPDILIGGPPCQAFSRLGRGKLVSLSDEGFVGDPRNKLYQAFLDAVRLWAPLAVVMENVTGMLSVGGTNYADTVTKELADLGYRTGYAALNAVWYGVPQYRERLFFIGIRDDLNVLPQAPPTSHQADAAEGYLRPYRQVTRRLNFGDDAWDRDLGQLVLPALAFQHRAVTVDQAIGDLPRLTDHRNGALLPRRTFRTPVAYGVGEVNGYVHSLRNWPGLKAPVEMDDHVTRRTRRDYDLFSRMKPGDRYPDALKLAEEHEEKLFKAKLLELAAAGTALHEGSKQWKKLRARYIPPYDAEIFLDKWRKLYPDKPSWTVPAHLGKDSYSHIHYDGEQARMITPREAARLQSFPDAFAFEGSMGDCFRQIGNAVPPLLAWAIAATLLKSLGLSFNAPPLACVAGGTDALQADTGSAASGDGRAK